MKLAVLGGAPVINPVTAHGQYPPIGTLEREALLEVLDSGQLWGPWGPRLRELETVWAERLGARFCSALNSGTAALHCALVGAGIGPGDEVIVPAYSFVASASSVLMAGAVPVFVDVEPETGNIDCRHVESVISGRTKGIVAVHLHGMPADIAALSAIRDRFRVAIIEDCAQAPGAKVAGRHVGTFFEAGAFSLNATKPLAGPEGGLLVTDCEQIFNKASAIRMFGVEQKEGRERVRDADTIGFNYRTNELLAAFTLARLRSFDAEAEVRQANAKRLAEGLAQYPGLSVPSSLKLPDHTYSMFRVRVDPKAMGIEMSAGVFREKLITALKAEGVFFWVWERRPLPMYRLFQDLNATGRHFPWSLHPDALGMKYQPEKYRVSLQLADDAIFTTSHFPPNGIELMDLYIEAFDKLWRNLDDVLKLEVCHPEPGYTAPF